MERQIEKMKPLTGEEQFKRFSILSKHPSIKGMDLTVENVQAALDEIDQQAIIDEEDKRYIYKVWDGEEEINGVDAMRMRSRFEIKGSAYLIKDSSGRVHVFQPHVPGEPGRLPMHPGPKMDAIGEDNRQSMANRAASRRIAKEAAEILRAKAEQRA